MRVNVVYAMPKTSQAYGDDADGFTAAMEIVQAQHDVRFLNVHPYTDDAEKQAEQIPNADIILVRSDWKWIPARVADKCLMGSDKPVGLFIAGSTMPPSLKRMLRYDCLIYETPWYAQFVQDHPFAIQAFGVDTRYMFNHGIPPKDRAYDWLFIGRLAPFKRPEALLEKTGRRAVYGDLSVGRPIEQQLRGDGVEVGGFITYPKLAEVYNDSRSVLVPCELQGGGERAVLEGRACGCHVEVATDNPKLQSLMQSPIWSHEEYADKILGALQQLSEGRLIPRKEKIAAQRAQRRWVLRDKVRRTHSTLRIRTESVLDALRKDGS